MICVLHFPGLFKGYYTHTYRHITQEVSAPGKYKYTPQEGKFSERLSQYIRGSTFFTLSFYLLYIISRRHLLLYIKGRSYNGATLKLPPHSFLHLCNFWWDKSRGAKFVFFLKCNLFSVLKKKFMVNLKLVLGKIVWEYLCSYDSKQKEQI